MDSPQHDAFCKFPPSHGRLASLGEPFPAAVQAWNAGPLRFEAEATTFGFVFGGEARLSVEFGDFSLRPGMFFAVPGQGEISGAGRGFAIARLGFSGFFQIGGPIEETGRLRYIDGCTDSLLISPVMRGDPCLNLLHIPPNTRQTQHTHPSFRAGIIASGHGRCVTPEEEHPLEPGLMFVIRAGGLHSFHTDGEALRVIAFHPDSDFGPTHEIHPMVNRTIIPTSAS